MAIDTPAKIAILGAGPIGLEAALYARFLGYDVEVFERGRMVENVRRWGHVRMFSPFGMNRSSLGLAAIAAQDPGYQPPPDDAMLTGQEWADRYLLPLAQVDLLSDHVREQAEVVAVGRDDLLKGDFPGDERRGDSLFRLLARSPQGEEIIEADAVIDASGVFGNPNWLGRGGIPARGETAAAPQIEYGLPDVLGADRAKHAGKRTLVVGSGYSAATTVTALAQLADQAPGTQAVWVTRRPPDADRGGPIPRIAGDRLAERDALAARANELARGGHPAVAHYPGAAVEAIRFDESTKQFEVELSGETAETMAFDRIVANTGHRPDTRVFSELQVHLCYASEGPMKLAAALMKSASQDCLDQASCGGGSLLNPEPNFYLLGAKSYGRNSHFLYSLGLAQIREVFSILGDRESLDLYATIKPLAE